MTIRRSTGTFAAGLGAIGAVTAVGLVGTATPAAADPGTNHGHTAAHPGPSVAHVPAKSDADDRYVVRPGDTVSAIAARYGSSIAAIVQANGLDSRALIRIGQVLTIPHGPSAAPAATTSTSRPTTSTSTSTARHTVKRGDTLSHIALRYGTTVTAIMKLNGLRSTVIHPGQVLQLAGGTSGGSSTSSSSGSSSASSGSASSGSSSSSSPSTTRYTVRTGDTVSAIALRYSTTVAAIVSANDLDGRALIRVGQVLLIPGTSGGSSSSGSSSSSSGSASSGSSSADSASTTRYTVRSGDTLSGIAAKHGTTVATITKLNSLSSTVIHPGQVLRVPEQLVPGTFLHYTYAPSVVAAANENKRTLLSMDLPSRTEMQDLIRTTAVQMGVDPALALAVAHQESGFNAAAVSPANAIGAMQVIPSSGVWASGMVGEDLDLLDPRDNVVAGVAILRYLVRTAPDLPTAIGGYYQGLSSVKKNGLYSDTRRYVANVQTLMTRYG